MTNQPIQEAHDPIDLTSEIISAYISHNALSPADLPKLIAEVYGALKGLDTPTVVAAIETRTPAVSIRKSITPDYLICLDDGKKLKTLKRHLTDLGMTPEQYREKWKLPHDYPMVAPNYSATRSALAKSLGLGRKPAEPPVPARKRTAAAKV